MTYKKVQYLGNTNGYFTRLNVYLLSKPYDDELGSLYTVYPQTTSVIDDNGDRQEIILPSEKEWYPFV